MVGTLTSAYILKSTPDCLEAKSDALFTSRALYLLNVLPPSPHPEPATAFNWISAWSWHAFKWICKWARVPIPSSVPPQPGPPWHSYGGQMVTAYRCPLSNVGIFAFGKHIPAHKAKDSSWGWATWKKKKKAKWAYLWSSGGLRLSKPLGFFIRPNRGQSYSILERGNSVLTQLSRSIQPNVTHIEKLRRVGLVKFLDGQWCPQDMVEEVNMAAWMEALHQE